jgi:Gpi18-like mannosyltransferase
MHLSSFGSFTNRFDPLGVIKQWKVNLLPWKQAFVVGITAFLGLRLWSSAVLLVLKYFPPLVIPSGIQVREQLSSLENNGVLSRLFLAPWYRWDSVYYLEIAQDGYSRPFLTVWPPLYSGLVRLVSLSGITPLLSAIIVSNLSAIMALILLFRMSEDELPGFGSQIVKCLVFFPTAFFLVAAYTESLYLCFTIASLWMGHRGRLKWASLWAALATLTRLQGVLLMLPLFYEGYRHTIRDLQSSDQKQKIRSILMVCLLSAIPVFAAGGYVLYIHFGIGAPWPWVTLNSTWGQHTGWLWEGLIGNFTSIFGLRRILTPINPLAQITDLILVLFALICLGGIWYRKIPIPVSYQIYACMGMVIILTKLDNQGLLVSASRYLLSLFPVFMAQAILINRLGKRITNLMLFTFGLTAQAILLVCFSWWIWIA